MRTRRSPRNQERLYKALGADLQRAAISTHNSEASPEDLVCPDGPSCLHPECIAERAKQGIVREPGPSLYEDVIALGIQHASHESDLYLPCTQEVIELLAKHGKKIDGWNVQRFANQVEGGTWLDVPFAYKPYWDARSTR